MAGWLPWLPLSPLRSSWPLLQGLKPSKERWPGFTLEFQLQKLQAEVTWEPHLPKLALYGVGHHDLSPVRVWARVWPHTGGAVAPPHFPMCRMVRGSWGCGPQLGLDGERAPCVVNDYGRAESKQREPLAEQRQQIQLLWGHGPPWADLLWASMMSVCRGRTHWFEIPMGRGLGI